jgi:hypothetical protein
MNTSDYIYLEPWTLRELQECFSRFASMQRLPSKFCDCIDGLDEFQGTPADLIGFVQSMSMPSNIKLCVSSRPWIEFSQAIEASPKLRVHELTTGDISRYARDNLESNSHYQRLYTLSPTGAEGLIHELMKTAQGGFFWVFLAVRDLLRGLQYDDDIPTLRRRLKTLPKHLEEYFEPMFVVNIDPVYHSETSVLFSILAYTEFPLNTYIPWAYRQLQAFRRSPEAFEHTPRHHQRHFDVSSLASVGKIETTADDGARRSVGLNRDDYSSRRERTRVLARCKDLVQVGDEI